MDVFVYMWPLRTQRPIFRAFCFLSTSPFGSTEVDFRMLHLNALNCMWERISHSLSLDQIGSSLSHAVRPVNNTQMSHPLLPNKWLLQFAQVWATSGTSGHCQFIDDAYSRSLVPNHVWTFQLSLNVYLLPLALPGINLQQCMGLFGGHGELYRTKFWHGLWYRRLCSTCYRHWCKNKHKKKHVQHLQITCLCASWRLKE